jgi:hypothetical protein
VERVRSWRLGGNLFWLPGGRKTLGSCIHQEYFALRPKDLEIRLPQKSKDYFLTIKAGVAIKGRMAFALKKKESVPKGVRRLGQRQVKKALEDLEHCDRLEAVHEIRKKIKELRALLRLVRPLLSSIGLPSLRCYTASSGAVSGHCSRRARKSECADCAAGPFQATAWSSPLSADQGRPDS